MKYLETDIIVDYTKAGIKSTGITPVLKSYLIDNKKQEGQFGKRPAMLVCPGGGYSMRAYHEGEPIALSFAAKGFQTFVLEYSVAPMLFPGALLELSSAVAYIRENAEEFNIDENRIFISGFSAGGHLAASLGVYWNEPFITDILGYTKGENRPNGLMLGYPVISAEEKIANTCTHCLFEGEITQKQLDILSLENHVSSLTPPTFLWHTSNDDCVDVRNSLAFASALRENDVLFELHIYKKGGHGAGLALKTENDISISQNCKEWIDEATNFFSSL